MKPIITRQARRIVVSESRKAGLSYEYAFSDRSFREIVKLRVRIAVRLRDELGYTYCAIGKILNKKHTSILYYYKNQNKILKSNYGIYEK